MLIHSHKIYPFFGLNGSSKKYNLGIKIDEQSAGNKWIDGKTRTYDYIVGGLDFTGVKMFVPIKESLFRHKRDLLWNNLNKDLVLNLSFRFVFSIHASFCLKLYVTNLTTQ